jgi:hypothetical protein
MAFGSSKLYQLSAVVVDSLVPQDQYIVSGVDNASATEKYYGFNNRFGRWYIMKETITVDVSVFTYFVPTTSNNIPQNYDAVWTARAAQIYVSYFATLQQNPIK